MSPTEPFTRSVPENSNGPTSHRLIRDSALADGSHLAIMIPQPMHGLADALNQALVQGLGMPRGEPYALQRL
jgi:hypothetical protein